MPTISPFPFNESFVEFGLTHDDDLSQFVESLIIYQ